MKLYVHGRFQLDVLREGGRRNAYRIEPGKRIRVPELAIPSEFEAADIASFRDDLHHEMARPGQSVRVLIQDGKHGRDQADPS